MDDKASGIEVNPIRDLLDLSGGAVITITGSGSLIKIETRSGSAACSEFVPNYYDDRALMNCINTHIEKLITANVHINNEKRSGNTDK